jgi:hypothetical protein
MQHSFLRRSFWILAPLTVPLVSRTSAAAVSEPVADTFPTQPPDLVRETVAVAHGNFKRLRELVDARPALAKAAWDWGFGDWEDALGAASHTGQRAIAEYLIEKGARPTLYSATMLGHLETVKAFVGAEPGVQRIPGPHSISLLAHAKAGGTAAEPVYRYLESLGDAGAPAPAPITEQELSTLTGTYAYGSKATEQIAITVDHGQLMFTRTGATGRGLIHVGSLAFHPMGASAVRIRFESGASGMTLKIFDPELVLAARRS